MNTTKGIEYGNYFIKDAALVKVTSVSSTKVNSTINPGDLTEITPTAAVLAAMGFIIDAAGVYRCPFADYITIASDLKTLDINGHIEIPLPKLHRIMNITKGMTEQDYTIDEEALKDAVLGVDLASPVVILTTKTSTTFEVGWSAITNAVGYQVSIDDGVTYGETQTGLTFTKSDATASTEYKVKVIAIAATGSAYRDSYPSTLLSVTTLTPLDSPVPVQDSVTATTFAVSWPAITNASGYQVSIDNGVTYGDTQVGLTFSKEDATPSTEYLVKVKAIGAGIYEDSPESTALSVNTPAE